MHCKMKIYHWQEWQRRDNQRRNLKHKGKGAKDGDPNRLSEATRELYIATAAEGFKHIKYIEIISGAPLTMENKVPNGSEDSVIT